jgi:hypothetical protein
MSVPSDAFQGMSQMTWVYLCVAWVYASVCPKHGYFFVWRVLELLHSDVCSIELTYCCTARTHTCHACARTDAHMMALDCRKSVPDCFLPPPHRGLDLSNNHLSVIEAAIFSGLASLTWVYSCHVAVDRVACASESVCV